MFKMLMDIKVFLYIIFVLFKFVCTVIITNSNSTKFQSSYNEVIETKNFKYNFHCIDNFNNACNIIKNDFIYSFEVLSNTLEFYQQIVFEVYVDDFSKYGLEHFIGQAVDINYIPLKKLNNKEWSQTYVYTQALAKQLNIKNKPVYKKNDFIMIFNNLKSNPQALKIFNRKKYSRIIIHEIIHAFGFTNNEILHELKNTDEPLSLLLSPIIYDEEKQAADSVKFVPKIILSFPWELLKQSNNINEYIQNLSNSKFLMFSPLSIFTKNIVDINTKEYLFKNLSLLHKEFNCFDNDNDNDNNNILMNNLIEKKYFQCYEQLSEKTKKLVTKIAKDYFLKEKSIGFLINENHVIPLQTFNEIFYPGSSVIHIDFEKNNEIPDDDDTSFLLNKDNIKYYYKEDTLLYYTQSDNVTNEEFLEIVGKNNKYGLIGPGIIEILKTMGWTEKGESRSSYDIYYVDNDYIFPEQNTFKYITIKYNKLFNEAQKINKKKGINVRKKEKRKKSLKESSKEKSKNDLKEEEKEQNGQKLSKPLRKFDL
ncbi:hypothetical protein BCR32DRAFT_269958 [Anaeromyces robustus]|uniref:Sequence orphan n=1 Tax=Anaeromyces robustus TaxID=1754192 RepID=A0A1Y1WZ04_9FUNG|nr:hypothetical protein BCR32DRAFT_269958 [Anaeromyces robustus]|eukprot:ORX78625.1 hypothetical protein BCR32DRAFT_269958 [Anaeromyces robustus]